MWNVMDITIVHADIRNINPLVAGSMFADSGTAMAKSVDVMVSELLGSFGDNELSPECLQAAARSGLLKDHAVSIPQSYRSYLAPISSMRLHAEARAQAYSPTRATDGPGGQPFGMLRATETPYVVRTYAASQMYIEKPCFEFRHVGKLSSSMSMPTAADTAAEDNDQFVTLEFRSDPKAAGSGCGYGQFDTAVATMSQNADMVPIASKTGVTVHGLLGTFEALLYRPRSDGSEKLIPPSVMISTAPSRFSTGMFSWFPLYFPLKEPIHVPYDATLRLNMWRRSEGLRVWYEWCVEVVLLPGSSELVLSRSGIHNPNGRSYYVSL